jgi:2-polyprenyl-6-methoxyphenol hydroxylase-like FAD-dependent oxidoreductase
MWGLSRTSLDTTLLNAARAAGAEILQPARCESLNGGVSVRDLCANDVHELTPDWTLLADGKAALLPDRPARTSDLGVKIHLTQIDGPRDRIELFGVCGHYVGIAPIEGGRWNAAFSVPAARVARFNGELDALWAAMMQENHALRRRCAGARAASPWLSSPLPRFGVVDHWPPRVIPLGNAAAALEPIGGEGMGLALRSALLAAQALIDAARRRADPNLARLRHQFRSLWQPRRLGCRALAKVIATPLFAGAALEWAAASESLSRVALALAGKR